MCVKRVETVEVSKVGLIAAAEAIYAEIEKEIADLDAAKAELQAKLPHRGVR